MQLCLRKSTILFIIFLIVLAPVHSMAQRGVSENKSDVEEAEQHAEIDAENDVNTLKWLSCGCIILAIGVGIAYFVVPTPPQERLIGKSSDYVWMYTRTYAKKTRAKQVKYSLIGCGITGTIAGIVMIVAVAKACSETSCDPIDLSPGCNESTR